MTLERYIIRNHIGPFFFSLSLITFVFIMDFILRYIDLFLNKGVKFHIVLQTFILSLGHMFALIIPMAVLPATLMTFGNSRVGKRDNRDEGERCEPLPDDPSRARRGVASHRRDDRITTTTFSRRATTGSSIC